jgi:uncharacterized membrane protein YeiB
MESAIPAASGSPTRSDESLAPIAAAQRIEALDVVRGFALIGIFLMNIEWFNRPFATFNEGMPRGLTGADWWASWFVTYFVQGKFWTIFSLLFGMGFAVMMVRAERAGREFKQVYLRRVLALAVFGALHFIFLWEGDILFSYAIAALMLMIVLYGKTRPLLLAIAVAGGLGFVPGWDDFFKVAGGLAAAGLLALYLRSAVRVPLRGLRLPIFCFLLFLLGAGLSITATVLWLLPNGPVAPRVPLSVSGPLVLIAAWLSWKYYEPAQKRSVRLAISLYVFAALAMTTSGLVQRFTPDPDAPPAVNAQPVADQKSGERKAGKTREERAAERRAEREKGLAENRAQKEKELRIYTQGRYHEAVELSAQRFLEKASSDFVFSAILMGMFLLGVWFVRSGVMEDTGAHLPFFRKLAMVGLPIGIAIGLAGSMIAMSHTAGDRADGWGIARGLLMLGNLPACLGYVGLMVVMLHSKTEFSRVAVLGPLGRMALTNYLMQSLICVIYFYGFALGHWGMPRAQQVLFVLIVYAAQIAFSRWWLSTFRYGPLEWFWRGFTYRQTPAFRL